MDPHREHDDSAPAPGPQSPADARDPGEPDPPDTLSPAVRRLVRHYDLDITGIHGTGPAGKIRVGDVIGMLGGRAEPSPRTSEAARGAAVGADDTNDSRATSGTPSTDRDAASEAATHDAALRANDFAAREAARPAPTTTVFECDLSRVLGDRKRERRDDVLLVSYFIAACVEALRAVPEIAAVRPGSTLPENGECANSPRLGVLLATTDGGVRRTLVTAAGPALDERLRAIDEQLRTSGDDDLHAAQLLIHHHGPSGSLLTTPTALGWGHAASVGIGRVRREIVVKTVDGEEAPRVAALCYLTLTFRPERVALERANRFVAELVRVLEQWPIEPARG
jgi:pyruvate/2-oxoglutarate dehydrogenase complex dihydrolipoamide acyltransferase (E2) component